MTLNQLNYFVVTCDCGNNMTMASKQLFVTQSAISCAIKELEEEFNIQLFFRGKKTLVLTEEGHRFYQLASAVIADTKKLKESFTAASPRPLSLRLGLSVLTGNLFSSSLAEFQRKHPDSELRRYTMQGPRLLDLLHKDMIDVAIMGWDINAVSPQYEVQDLGRVYSALHLRRDHPLAQHKSLSTSQLEDLPLCFFAENEAVYGTDGLKLQKRYIPNIKEENIEGITTFLTAVKNYLLEGKGGAFVLSGIDFANEDIVEVEVRDVQPVNIAAIWRKEAPLPAEADQLFSDIRKFLKTREEQRGK